MITCSNLRLEGKWLFGHIYNESVREACDFKVSIKSSECYCTNPTDEMLKNIVTVRSYCIRRINKKKKIPKIYTFCYY